MKGPADRRIDLLTDVTRRARDRREPPVRKPNNYKKERKKRRTLGSLGAMPAEKNRTPHCLFTNFA